MSHAIEIKGLSKRYGDKTYALRDLNLNVQAGEVFGYLGANGAGKTTTIRTLLNFIQPSSGSARILGYDIVRDSVKLKHHIGYLSGELALYPKMTGRQFLGYMTALQKPKRANYRHELIKTFGAELDKPLKELSKGNRQKIGLIQAFMHEPEVIILDEPTSGLDPLMQEAFFELVRASKKRGVCLFISSHNLSEVQRMCDRVGFIRAGKLVAEQSIVELNASASQSFDVTFGGKAPLEQFTKLSGIQVVSQGHNRITAHISGDLSPFLSLLARSKVTRLDKPSVNLEEEFMQFYSQPSENNK